MSVVMDEDSDLSIDGLEVISVSAMSNQTPPLVPKIITRSKKNNGSFENFSPDSEKKLNEEQSGEDLIVMKAKAWDDMMQHITKEDNQLVEVIYMTNKQAAAVAEDENTMNQLVDSLRGAGKKKPSLIIDLVHTWGFKKSMLNYLGKDFVASKFPPFKNFEDELQTLTRLDHFMEHVLIPLAEETSAIVLCSAITSRCFLSRSFSKTVNRMTARWDDNPPFSVVGTLSQVEDLYKNDTETSNWKKVLQQCKQWNDRHNLFLNDYYKRSRKIDRRNGKLLTDKEKKRRDITWCRKLIIIEGLDTDVIREGESKQQYMNPKNLAPYSALLDSIVRSITQNAAALAIKTGSTGRSGEDLDDTKTPRGIEPTSMQMLVGHAHRGVKVLCLDMRTRKDEKFLSIANVSDKAQYSMDNEQNNTPSSNNFSQKKFESSSDSSSDEENQSNHGENHRGSIMDRGLSFRFIGGEEEPIHRSEELIKSIKQLSENRSDEYFSRITKLIAKGCDLDKDKGECQDICALAYLLRLLKLKEKHLKNLKEKEAKEEMMNDSQHEEDADSNEDVQKGLRAAILEYDDDKPNQADATNFVKYANMFATEFYRNVLKHSKKSQLYKNWKEKSDKNADELTGMFGDEIKKNATLVRNLLMSSNVYSLNIWDEGIKDVLYDDIICENTAERASIRLLRLLKDAWDEVDATNMAADYFKKFCKTSYFIQVFLALCVTALSVLDGYIEGSSEYLKWVTLGFTLVLAFLASVDVLITPKLSWRHLRLHAVSLESTLWKCRMRVGVFEEDPEHATPGLLEDSLSKEVSEWRKRLASKASGHAISKLLTHFTVRVKSGKQGSNKYRRSSKPRKNGDDNFSALSGQQYMNFRVTAMKELYKEKISKNQPVNMMFQICVIILGGVIAFITQLGEPIAVILLVGLLSSLNLCTEFLGLTERIALHSDAIMSCRTQESKWHGLNKFKKQNRDTIRQLVIDVEDDIVMQVVKSWSSTMEEKNPPVKAPDGSNEGGGGRQEGAQE